MTKIETSFNGRDWSVLADGHKVGSVMDLRPAARGGQPFSATVVWGRPASGALGGFGTVAEAVQAIANAHARRVRRKAPPAAKPDPATAPAKSRLQIQPSKEFPQTNSTVHFDGEVIGKIGKLPAYDGRPFQGMHLTQYYPEGPGFGHTGLFASREEAARAIHERWTLKPVKRPDWVRK